MMENNSERYLNNNVREITFDMCQKCECVL